MLRTMNRTEPSPSRKWTPPEWSLLKPAVSPRAGCAAISMSSGFIHGMSAPAVSPTMIVLLSPSSTALIVTGSGPRKIQCSPYGATYDVLVLPVGPGCDGHEYTGGMRSRSRLLFGPSHGSEKSY